MSDNKKLPAPNMSAFRVYETGEALGQMIPLRAGDKRPSDNAWTTRDYSAFDAMGWAKSGGNLGFRMSETDLIIDVDVQNFEEGDDPFARLQADLGIDLSSENYPTVITGSGGRHVYVKVPAGFKAVNELKDKYRGVEFKGHNKQVVAAGSVHPNGNLYQWDDAGFFMFSELTETPQAPNALLSLVEKKAVASDEKVEPGELNAEQAEKILDALNPEDFNDNDSWMNLMMAVHHGTNGDPAVRDLFLEWSQRDAHYNSEHLQGEINTRWASIDTDADGGVTVKSLYKILHDGDLSHLIPQEEDNSVDMFAELGDDESVLEGAKDAYNATEEARVPLTEHVKRYKGSTIGEDEIVSIMNQYVAFHEGKSDTYHLTHVSARRGKTYIMFEQANRNKARNCFSNANFMIEVPGPKGEPVRKKVNGFSVWEASEDRRGIVELVIDPSGKETKDSPELFNLWQGFDHDPKPGDVTLFKQLVAALCNHHKGTTEYVTKWMAHLMQHPEVRHEAVPIFIGREGTGKTTLSEVLAKIIGKGHAKIIGKSGSVTDKFNGELSGKVFVLLDEAVRARNEADVNTLKTLVTGDELPIENKGLDRKYERNYLSVMMATNSDNPVDAGPDSRRYIPIKVSEKLKDTPGYFSKLHAWLPKEGYSHILHYLLGIDITGYNPRDWRNMVDMTVFAEQVERGLAPSVRAIIRMSENFAGTGQLCPAFFNKDEDAKHEGGAIADLNEPYWVIDRELDGVFAEGLQDIIGRGALLNGRQTLRGKFNDAEMNLQLGKTELFTLGTKRVNLTQKAYRHYIEECGGSDGVVPALDSGKERALVRMTMVRAPNDMKRIIEEKIGKEVF